MSAHERASEEQAPMRAPSAPVDPCLTVAEIAERLKFDPETVRRLFSHEPGVIVICIPKKSAVPKQQHQRANPLAVALAEDAAIPELVSSRENRGHLLLTEWQRRAVLVFRRLDERGGIRLHPA